VKAERGSEVLILTRFSSRFFFILKLITSAVAVEMCPRAPGGTIWLLFLGFFRFTGWLLESFSLSDRGGESTLAKFYQLSLIDLARSSICFLVCSYSSVRPYKLFKIWSRMSFGEFKFKWFFMSVSILSALTSDEPYCSCSVG